MFFHANSEDWSAWASESSLGAHVILLVLSCGGSFGLTSITKRVNYVKHSITMFTLAISLGMISGGASSCSGGTSLLECPVKVVPGPLVAPGTQVAIVKTTCSWKIKYDRKVLTCYKGRVKQIWSLSPMRAAKVQASLRIRAASPEPLLLAQTSRESRGIFRQKARSLAPLNGWACSVKICHVGMLEDINSLDAAHM